MTDTRTEQIETYADIATEREHQGAWNSLDSVLFDHIWVFDLPAPSFPS